MAARVRATASTGSHQAVAPMAMRLGMASGAVAGKNETSRAQAAVGAPDGGERDEVAGDQHDAHRPGDALRVLGPRGERAERAVHHGVEGVAEHEPHDGPGEHGAAGGRDVDGVDDGRRRRARPARSRPIWAEPEQPDAGDLAGQQVAGRHAGEQHLDDPARLLLHHAGQHQVPVGGDGR